LPDLTRLPPAFAMAAIYNFPATGDPNWPVVTGLLGVEQHPA
jgi:hypothetical protein